MAAIVGLWNDVIANTAITFTTELKTHAGVSEDILCKNTPEYNAFLVAEGDSGLLGFATFFQFRNGPGYAKTVEHSITLAPQAHGQGVGARLLDALCDEAKRYGAHSIFAGVSGENPKAVTFHHKQGFHHVATLKEVGFKFNRWMDLVLMQKIL